MFEVRNDAIHTAMHLMGYLRGVSALRANANWKIRTLKERAKLFPEQESKELATIERISEILELQEAQDKALIVALEEIVSHCDHLKDDGIGNAAENGICSICGANVQKWGR